MLADDRIKRPAYQWYPADANNDEVFKLMSYEQQGIYRALLDHQWVEGSIPADPRRVFGLLPKLKSYERFQKLWPLILGKFRLQGDDRMVNDRLETQRRTLEAYVETQAANGAKGAEKRWKVDGGAMATPSAKNASSSSSSTATTTTTTGKSKNGSSATSAEPLPASPSVLVFPTVGTEGTSWALTEAQIASWGLTYPNCDVLAEARKALAWIEANSGHRKTPRGMPAFLVRWLNRATDRPTTAMRPFSGNSKTAGNDAALATFVARHGGKPS